MKARRALLGGAVVLAALLLILANVFAVQTFHLMGEDAGGFVLFVNSIGVMALTGVGVGVVIMWRVPENRIGPIQRAVDRRFDRARYDGERTVAAFADRLRDPVVLRELEADIASTFTNVLRPVAVGLWMRTEADRR